MAKNIKKIRSSSLVLASILSMATCYADEQVILGMGIGALYNGLGANIGFTKESDLKYVSLGCISLGYGSYSGISSSCGVGAGWMRSDILSDNDKHGIGIHLGATYNTSDSKNDMEAFIGIPYVYFFNAMNYDGWNIGFTPLVGKYDDNRIGRLLLNLGYHF